MRNANTVSSSSILNIKFLLKLSLALSFIAIISSEIIVFLLGVLVVFEQHKEQYRTFWSISRECYYKLKRTVECLPTSPSTTKESREAWKLFLYSQRNIVILVLSSCLVRHYSILIIRVSLVIKLNNKIVFWSVKSAYAHFWNDEHVLFCTFTQSWKEASHSKCKTHYSNKSSQLIN